MSALLLVGYAFLAWKYFKDWRHRAPFYENRKAVNALGGLNTEIEKANEVWVVWPAGGAASNALSNGALKKIKRLIVRNPMHLDRTLDYVKRFGAISPANVMNVIFTLTDRTIGQGGEVHWHDDPLVSVIIFDPTGSNGRARIELLLPETEAEHRPSVVFSRSAYPKLFQAVVEMYNALWKESTTATPSLLMQSASHRTTRQPSQGA